MERVQTSPQQSSAVLEKRVNPVCGVCPQSLRASSQAQEVLNQCGPFPGAGTVGDRLEGTASGLVGLVSHPPDTLIFHPCLLGQSLGQLVFCRRLLCLPRAHNLLGGFAVCTEYFTGSGSAPLCGKQDCEKGGTCSREEGQKKPKEHFSLSPVSSGASRPSTHTHCPQPSLAPVHIQDSHR